jgi:alpha-tubulin suppressor-like RCC1 family protein
MLGRQNSEDVVTAEIQELRDEQIVQISCGGEYSLALTRSGDVFAWGSNNQGQLGHGGRRGSRVPKRIDVLAGKKIVKIVAGWKHTMYMTDTGVLYAAGFNFKGQLGLGIDTNIDQLVPVEITFLSEKRVLMIGAGANHSFAVVAYENK